MLPQYEQSMTTGCCTCRPRSATSSGRRWDIMTGGLSFGIWILVPKCPACVAAHVALWTGLGISFTQAAYLRWLLLSLSITFVCYLVIKQTRKSGIAAHERN